MILLDTNVVSELMKPQVDKQVSAWFDDIEISETCITMITQAELLAGVEMKPAGRKRDQLATLTQKMLDIEFKGRVLLFDDAASRSFAVIAAERKKRGRPISEHDCQIAGIAKSRNLKLVTRNVRDFDFTDIEIVDPWI